jgi:hypothetical protein
MIPYTPTLVWSGATPGTLTVGGYYARVGNLIFFTIYVDGADSNSSSLTSATLPATAHASPPQYFRPSSLEYYGNAYATKADPMALITANSNTVTFADSKAGTDGQPIRYHITGWYYI